VNSSIPHLEAHMQTLLVDSMLGPMPASYLHSALVTRHVTLDEHHFEHKLPSILVEHHLPSILGETLAAERKCHACSLDYCDSCSTPLSSSQGYCYGSSSRCVPLDVVSMKKGSMSLVSSHGYC